MVSAIFATTGLIVPIRVAGKRKVRPKWIRMRTGQEKSSRNDHCPRSPLTNGIVMQPTEEAMKSRESVRRGSYRSASRPPQ